MASESATYTLSQYALGALLERFELGHLHHSNVNASSEKSLLKRGLVDEEGDLTPFAYELLCLNIPMFVYGHNVLANTEFGDSYCGWDRRTKVVFAPSSFYPLPPAWLPIRVTWPGGGVSLDELVALELFGVTTEQLSTTLT